MRTYPRPGKVAGSAASLSAACSGCRKARQACRRLLRPRRPPTEPDSLTLGPQGWQSVEALAPFLGPPAPGWATTQIYPEADSTRGKTWRNLRKHAQHDTPGSASKCTSNSQVRRHALGGIDLHRSILFFNSEQKPCKRFSSTPRMPLMAESASGPAWHKIGVTCFRWPNAAPISMGTHLDLVL
jgi:hypothetical protein